MEWGEVLAGLTGEQIKQGIANLDSEWPPTAQGFRELCTIRQHESHRFLPELPMPEVEPEYVESQIEEMRKILEGKS